MGFLDGNKRISFGQGKGSLTHNNRTFIAKNVDESRIPDNVVFIAQPIAEAYEQLFRDSQERYNARQKRNDRKIHGTYYESLFHQEPSNSVVTAADKRKSFYEDVVQIGKMEDSGIGTEDAELVAECLKEYMNGFQARNSNFYVFNAILHMDEATPHLHIDYTLLLNSGVDIKVVSEHLGHCDIGVTANIYADVLKSTKSKVADLVSLKSE